ncbi:MAG: PAS domain-containing protein [bacterium]
MHHAAAAASRWPHDPSATPLGKTHDEQPGTFRELADHCRDVVWVRDARNAELTYVNAAYRSLWGRDAEDARDVLEGTVLINPGDRLA